MIEDQLKLSTPPSTYHAKSALLFSLIKHELARHAATCMSKDDGQKISLKQMKYEGHLLLDSKNVTECSNELRKNVITKMASDEVTAVAEDDPTIVTLGSVLLEKQGREKSTEVSQSMRLLARVVIEARKKPP